MENKEKNIIKSQIIGIIFYFAAFASFIAALLGNGAIYWIGTVVATVIGFYFFDHYWKKNN